VLPVAEPWNVRLAMHPDEPPLSPIRGVGRIMRSVENFQRLLDLHPSPMNGVTRCQGTFTLMTHDLPGVIRHFQDKNFLVHFRDVKGTPERFEETWHDAGQTDMLACMRAYRDIRLSSAIAAISKSPTTRSSENLPPSPSALAPRQFGPQVSRDQPRLAPSHRPCATRS
jgi:mannonate dehydratase